LGLDDLPDGATTGRRPARRRSLRGRSNRSNNVRVRSGSRVRATTGGHLAAARRRPAKFWQRQVGGILDTLTPGAGAGHHRTGVACRSSPRQITRDVGALAARRFDNALSRRAGRSSCTGRARCLTSTRPTPWKRPSRRRGRSTPNGTGTRAAPSALGSRLAQARAAALVVDVQTKRLPLRPGHNRAQRTGGRLRTSGLGERALAASVSRSGRTIDHRAPGRPTSPGGRLR
jgi:hypothetical protein